MFHLLYPRVNVYNSQVRLFASPSLCGVRKRNGSAVSAPSRFVSRFVTDGFASARFWVSDHQVRFVSLDQSKRFDSIWTDCTRQYPTKVRIVMIIKEANWSVCTEKVNEINCLESTTRDLPGRS